jgi:phosphoribosylaminoimidazole-succinocarboxamide synthase
MMALYTATELPGLTLVSRGKVRDIYSTSSTEHLLFVASDRISAYDVILKNVCHEPLSCMSEPADADDKGIPGKGKVLTKISLFWFEKLKHIIPNHFVTASIDDMPAEIHQHKPQLEGRSMLVRKAKVVPLEAIVRGYLTGGVSFPIFHATVVRIQLIMTHT